MSDAITLQPADHQIGQRLDKVLAESLPDLSRTEAQRLIKASEVQVNGRTSKSAYKLEAGDTVTLSLPQPLNEAILAENITLDLLYEDEAIVAINKPAGMVVHPAYGSRAGTIVNAALYHWPEMRRVTGEERAGIVHRLDKETSGALVMAKTSPALKNLQAQFKARTVHKVYLALVEGLPSSSSGVINAPLARDPKQRKRMAVVRDGREAISQYRVVEEFEEHTLLEMELKTGRTHQIRVHLAWLGNPGVGDTVYGYRKQRIKLNRHFLHATLLEVDSTLTGERLSFNAPLPAGLSVLLEKLRNA
jgi:23S rRNA pseudouridine1911/1915/1917 synthase